MKSGIAIFDKEHISGSLYFYKVKNDIIVNGVLTGNISGKYGCHIHKFVDPNISMLGGHYDKTGNKHPYHTGDLPNAIFTNKKCNFNGTLKNVTLEQLYGRALVIHTSYDDMKHIKNGHSGEIKDFAIIGRTDVSFIKNS